MAKSRREWQIGWVVLAMGLFAGTAWGALTATQSVSPTTYTPGQSVTVTTTITYSDALTALGFRAALPAGWSYQSTGGAAVAPVTPSAGATGTIEFAWITPPVSPATFTYTVSVPGGNAGAKTIDGEVEYRTTGAALIVPATPDPLSVQQKAPAPDISVNPTTLLFGSVTVNTTSGEQSVTIHNAGSADLNVTAFTTTGSGFQRNSASAAGLCGAVPFVLKAGSECAVKLTYSPTALGASNGTFAVVSNDPDTPSSVVSLGGTGKAAPSPELSIKPVEYNFGLVSVGTTSSSATFTLSNTGDMALNATGLNLTDSTNFVLDANGGGHPCGSAPFSIAAGGNCTVTVSAKPSVTGALTGKLTVASNDPASPIQVNLSQGTSPSSGGGGGGGGGGVCFVQMLEPGSLSPLGLIVVGLGAASLGRLRNRRAAANVNA